MKTTLTIIRTAALALGCASSLAFAQQAAVRSAEQNKAGEAIYNTVSQYPSDTVHTERVSIAAKVVESLQKDLDETDRSQVIDDIKREIRHQ